MKINVPGKTPMERLSNLTKRIVAVPKDEVEREERKWRKSRTKHRSESKTRSSDAT
jgi:hypothetical protein